jgi:hypothetical protein
MTSPPPEPGDSDTLSPEEAFALLGNETRVGILQALWDAFESGRGGNAVSYSTLFDRAPIDDSGNFSYHLEKLTGPFVRSTEAGYELKQTGINVVRAVLTGTVIDDPEFGPTPVDVDCPLCGAPVEVAYADELITVHCTSCPGTRHWGDEPGFLFAGLLPPASVEQRSVEDAFQAALVYANYQFAALHDGACPHCSGPVETTVDVCGDHQPSEGGLCPNCDWAHMAEVWMVCSTCKRSAFPPARVVVLDDPNVTAFYHDHGIEYRFASWETVVRSTRVEEELLSEAPLRMRFTVPAGDDELRLTVDDELHVLDVTQ